MHRLKGKTGFTLVEILIVVFVISVLAAIAIPNMLRSRTTANNAAAKATLGTISDAAEAYALLHNGAYPTSISDLLNADPAYLSIDYTAAPKNGYYYACTWTRNDYSCCAYTYNMATENKVFVVYTGGIKYEYASGGYGGGGGGGGDIISGAGNTGR